MLTSRERGLLRKLVAEADAVVVDAEHDVQAAPWQRLLDQADAQLVVAVAHEAPLAPGLLPGFVRAALFLARESEVALELRGIRQDEAQPRFRDDGRATPADRIARPAVRVEHDRHRERAIRGCDFSDRFRGCDATDRAERGGQDCGGQDSHGGEANRTGKPAGGCKRFHALQSYAFIAGGGGRPLGSMRPAGSAPFAYGGRKSWNSRAFHATCCAWRSPPRYRRSQPYRHSRNRRPAATARGRHRHRYPRRHRERDRDQAPGDEHRRGDLGRGHRQAARYQHRGIHLPPPGPDIATCRRPRLRDQPARHRPRIHDRAPERTRTGQHRRQPQRRVRPVSVRAPELGSRLQDAGLPARGAGTRGHDRPSHDPPAAIRRRRDRPEPPRRAELERQPRRELGRRRVPRELLDRRPVHGRPIRHRLRLCAPRHAAGDARFRHIRAAEPVGDRRRPRVRLPGRQRRCLPEQSGHCARQHSRPTA